MTLYFRFLKNVLLALVCAALLISCAPVGPKTTDPEFTVATLPQTPLPVTATQTPMPTATLDPNRDFSSGELVPMYKVGNTSALQEVDIYPQVDIVTKAEARLRKAGFTTELDQISEKMLTRGGRLFLGSHTLSPIYALNTLTAQPVYTFFVYDETGDCLLYPYAVTNIQQSDPNQMLFTYAHSGDISELEPLVTEGPDTYIGLGCLTVPSGLSDGGDIRLVATKDGIVPGAFYNGTNFVGWFDFEKREWHITQFAQSFLEVTYKSLNSPTILENNLSNWLNGTTTIPLAEIFEESAGKPLNFNLFKPNSPFAEYGSENFYGVLLGTEVKNDDLFAYIGFEDVAGTRYYLPFNFGAINEETCGTFVATTPSNFGRVHTYLDQKSYYHCPVLKLILGNYNNKPISLIQYIVPWEKLSPLQVDPKLANLYESQQEYANSLARYIYNSAYTPIGENTFNDLINPSPEKVTRDLYPPLLFPSITFKKEF